MQKVEKFGVFVWLGPGRVGLVPNVHSGTRKGTDLSKAFSVGKEIEVEVVEADPDGRRIRLAVPGAAARTAPAPFRPEPQVRRERERDSRRQKPAEGPAPAASQGFGTSLGDALREAMKKNTEER